MNGLQSEPEIELVIGEDIPVGRFLVVDPATGKVVQSSVTLSHSPIGVSAQPMKAGQVLRLPSGTVRDA